MAAKKTGPSKLHVIAERRYACRGGHEAYVSRVLPKAPSRRWRVQATHYIRPGTEASFPGGNVVRMLTHRMDGSWRVDRRRSPFDLVRLLPKATR
jgi:hypothetical protein